MPPQFQLHPVDQNFKGMSYGELIAQWANWLFSDQADYSEASDVLFLRGNIGHYQDGLASFYDKTNDVEKGEAINKDAAVLVPVICTYLTLHSSYEGYKIEDELALRTAVNRTVHAGGAAWAKIKIGARGTVNDIVPPASLSDFYVESPLFKLFVSEKSKLRDQVEDPLEPGEHEAIVAGYFILLKKFNSGTYRIRFGGKGKGNYVTDSIYDITVSPNERQSNRKTSLGTQPTNYPPVRVGFGI